MGEARGCGKGGCGDGRMALGDAAARGQTLDEIICAWRFRKSAGGRQRSGNEIDFPENAKRNPLTAALSLNCCARGWIAMR